MGLSVAVSWTAFYSGVALLLVVAHYGQPRRDRLDTVGVTAIGLLTALLPIAAFGGPPVVDLGGFGPFALVEFLFRVGLVFVGGGLFGMLGFITYEVATGIPEKGT